jgi:molecular chaperone DnaK
MRLRLTLLAMLVACARPSPIGSAMEARSPAIRDGALTQNLGIESMGDRFTPLLSAGCRVPCLQSFTFSTTEDSQASITLHVLRGDTGLASRQHSLGRYAISGFPLARRGVPQVLVIFGAVGNDLTLDARDAETGARYRVEKM